MAGDSPQWERTLVVAGCVFILLLVFVIMVCKLNPKCVCHRLSSCVWRPTYGDEKEKDTTPPEQEKEHAFYWNFVSPEDIMEKDLKDPPSGKRPDTKHTAIGEGPVQPAVSEGSRLTGPSTTSTKSYDTISLQSTRDPGTRDPGTTLQALQRGAVSFDLQWLAEDHTLAVTLNQASHLTYNTAKAPREVGLLLHLVKGTGYIERDIHGFEESIARNLVQKAETKMKKDVKNPVFSESFRLQVDGVIVDHSLRLLTFTRAKGMCDYHGELLMRLDELDLTQCCHLEETLHIANQEPKGEIKIGLCYRPTSEKLQVTLCECRNLQLPRSGEGPEEIYTKIQVIHKSHSMKKKRSRTYKCLNSIDMNESFMFDVSRARVADCSIVLTITQSEEPSQGKCVVGQALIGNIPFPNAQLHWNAMMNSPRQSVDQWHLLG